MIWLLTLLSLADGRAAPLKYSLVEIVEYDGGDGRLLRYLRSFDNWSDCLAERDKRARPHYACVANAPGEDL
jgi:hypothetical protein